MIHLSVDGMGGDNAPKEICQGVMKALHEYKNIKITIFVNGKLMNPYLEKNEFEEYSKPYVRKETNKESGSGLGLNICIAIMNEHGFTITCEKSKYGGTKLKIKL